MKRPKDHLTNSYRRICSIYEPNRLSTEKGSKTLAGSLRMEIGPKRVLYAFHRATVILPEKNEWNFQNLGELFYLLLSETQGGTATAFKGIYGLSRRRLNLFHQYKDATSVQMAPGLIRRTLISGETLMICRFDLEGGVEIPGHSHPHYQAGYVVSGLIRVTVDGQSSTLGPGDSYCAPSGILHSAIALEKTVVVDTFSPPREDYRTA